MKNFRALIIAAWIVVTLQDVSLAQQNIQFTQYIFNSLGVNPAYAGYKEQWFGQMALRNQWTGIDDSPRTGQLSIDGLLNQYDKRMGIGFQVGADRLGPQSSSSAYLNYSYRLRLDKDDSKRLSFGIGAGVSQYALDNSKLSPIDDGDEQVVAGESSKVVPDLRFGVYYNSARWYLGASILDLLSERASSTSTAQGIITHRKHVYIMSGVLMDLNESIKLRPSFLIKEDFKGPTSVDINSMLIFKERFWIGASYRSGLSLWKKDFQQGQTVSNFNSVSGVAQFFLNDAFRLGYSYDYTINGLSSIQTGSHELTMGLTLSRRVYKLLTPRFF